MADRKENAKIFRNREVYYRTDRSFGRSCHRCATADYKNKYWKRTSYRTENVDPRRGWWCQHCNSHLQHKVPFEEQTVLKEAFAKIGVDMEKLRDVEINEYVGKMSLEGNKIKKGNSGQEKEISSPEHSDCISSLIKNLKTLSSLGNANNPKKSQRKTKDIAEGIVNMPEIEKDEKKTRNNPKKSQRKTKDIAEGFVKMPEMEKDEKKTKDNPKKPKRKTKDIAEGFVKIPAIEKEEKKTKNNIKKETPQQEEILHEMENLKIKDTKDHEHQTYVQFWDVGPFGKELEKLITSVEMKEWLTEEEVEQAVQELRKQEIKEKEKGINVKHSNLYREENRIASYKSWPHDFMSPIELAEAGLSYTGEGDKVECFQCQIKIEGWKKGDRAMTEHLLWSPDCSMAQGKSDTNISMEKGRDTCQRYEEGYIPPIKEEKEHLCRVCMARPMNTVLLPCRHLAICHRCSDLLTKCSLCRSTIEQRIKVYYR